MKAIKYADAIAVLDVLARMECDYAIFRGLTDLISAAVPGSESGLTGQQRSDLVVRISRIIGEKFPADQYIRHDGYVVASEAELGRLRKLDHVNGWKDLIRRANGLSNWADRAFVLASIVRAIPNRADALRKDAIEDAFMTVKDLPLSNDKFELLEVLARSTRRVDPTRAKDCVKMAFDMLQDIRSEMWRSGKGGL